MPTIDLSESLDGQGEVAGLLAWSVYLSDPADGAGDLTGEPVQTFMVGGQVRGFGTLTGEQVYAGQVGGLGEVTGDFVQTFFLRGVVRGLGNFRDSVPMPLAGYGSLQAYVEVTQAPLPICTPDTRQRFGYQTQFQRGGLELCLCDGQGNPYSPVTVTYAVYEVLAGGYRQLRGSPRRVPAKAGIGRYYATGYLGECGQPGDWVIVWSWSGGGGCQTREESFVLEAGPPLANPCGCVKYGWD